MTDEQKKLMKEEALKAENVRIKYMRKSFFSLSNISLLVASGSTLVTNIFLNEPVLLGVGVGLTTLWAVNALKLNKDSKMFACKVAEGLHESHPEYGPTKQSYYKLIGNLAEFIKSYGFDDPLDIGLFYQQLLHNGILSVGGDFEYYNNEEEYDIHMELDGARVCSGKAVCRHMGKNLVDLFNAMGIVAAPMLVKGLQRNDLFLKVPQVATVFQNLLTNHLNVAVTSDKGRFIVDPTWQTVAEFGYKGYAKDNLATIVFSESGSVSNPVYYIESNSYQLSSNGWANNYMGGMLLAEQPRKFESGEIGQASARAKALFEKAFDRIIKFRNENIGLMMDVYRGEKHISFNNDVTIDEPFVTTKTEIDFKGYEKAKIKYRFYSDESV